MHSFDMTTYRIANAGTAVHIQISASGIHGTAGIVLFSGHIDTYQVMDQRANVMRQTLTYHANVWSAYGV